ncbi:universal stress protein [Streptomyces massasporeus]|uniref:universal stress protein n=1 Tax=Streptomyces massasporeus TaxID=67324 RepID=UPI0036FBCB19
MVGIEGSEASLEAVDWAADEAVRHGVPLHLLHAVERGAARRRGLRPGRQGAQRLCAGARAVVGVEEGEGSGTAVQFALREAQVCRCRLGAVHAWSTQLGALTTPQAPSGYALEAHRRSPAQVLDDALRTPEPAPGPDPSRATAYAPCPTAVVPRI